MPDRPGLDDDETLKSLIALWTDGSADLDARLSVVQQRLRAELLGGVNANTVERLRLQVRRLDELTDVAAHIVDDLTQGTKRWLDDGGLARVYVQGAGVTAGATRTPFSFTQPHRAAVEVLSKDLFDDVLVATEFIDADSKRWVRETSRMLTGFKLTAGTTAQTQARRFAADLKQQFERRGMGSVVYRDGSRHRFGEYAEMLLRTKTGVAYNTGTLNSARAVGIEFYELLDGSLCGLTSHQDSQLANGLIVDYGTAMSYPLSHPNCRRSVNPRPDLNKSNVGDAVSVQSPEARKDQAAFEAAMREQAARRGRRGAGGVRRPRRERRTRQTAAARSAAPTPVSQPAADLFDLLEDELTTPEQIGASKPGEIVRVARGPRSGQVANQPGAGSAMVDDFGRLFYAETDLAEAGAARIREMAEEMMRALPNGAAGPKRMVSFVGRSVDDAYWTKRYGREFWSNASAGSHEITFYNGGFTKTTTWHEVGHMVAKEVNDKVGDAYARALIDRNPFDDGRDLEEQIKWLRTRVAYGDNDALDAIVRRFPVGPNGLDEALQFIEGEAREQWAKFTTQLDAEFRRFHGTGPDPGAAWRTAAQADADFLEKKRFPSTFQGTYSKPIAPRGMASYADQPAVPAVTGYGASVQGVEDFAESWALYILDKTTGGIGTAKFGKFFRPVRFAEMFPNRAKHFDAMLDAVDWDEP